jgi:hypothetical protein
MATPSHQDFDLYAGRDCILQIPAVDEDGSPYNFEAQTHVSWWLGLSKPNPLVIKSSLLPGEITLADGLVLVRVRNTDTRALRPSSDSRGLPART